MSDPYEALFKRTALGIRPGLEVITDLLQALDNPHRRLAVVHVAGTNGKGSVCAMIEAVLRASGFKTGLYTSPHLIDFSERFRINGAPIPGGELKKYIAEMETTADRVAEETAKRPATFFEISTAIAFRYFADEEVDIAVIETGMGGRWDATNVIIPLVSVITHIDIDHADYLGGTVEEIAAEKAGIIKSGRPVLSAPQPEAVMAVLQQQGEPIIVSTEAVSVVKVDGASSSVKRNAMCRTGLEGDGSSVQRVQKLKIETPSRRLPPIQLPLLGECQRENCALAVAALEVMADMLSFEPEFKRGLEAVSWRARFQQVAARPPVIVDGAHNPSAARALAQALKEIYPGCRIGFIFGFLDDKDSAGFLRVIKPLVSQAWTVSIDAARGMTARQAADQVRAAGMEAVPLDTADAWEAACAWASEAPHRLVCITGSLYLAGGAEWPVPPAAQDTA